MTETSSAPWAHPLRVADLAARKPTRFRLTPPAEALAALAEAIGASALRKVTFEGEVRPTGRHDWVLEAKLGATVVQPCVVTLAPVTTRIEEDIRRRYMASLPETTEGGETEMPEDDSVELLSGMIDPGRVMEESLALALPLYPRADGADLGEAVFTEPGQTPLRDAEIKPFASLAALRDKLTKEE